MTDLRPTVTRVLFAVVLVGFNTQYDAQAKATPGRCNSTPAREGEAVHIQFSLASEIDLENDPTLLIRIKKHEEKGDILRCDRERPSSNITCDIIDKRFRSEGLKLRSLSVLLLNATHAMEGEYLISAVVGGEFMPAQSCRLTLTTEAGVKPERRSNDIFLIAGFSVAIPVMFIVMVIVWLVLRSRWKKRPIRERQLPREDPNTEKELSFPLIDVGPTDQKQHGTGEINDSCGIILIGKTGAGKSSTGNTIIGSTHFNVLKFSSSFKCEKETTKRSGAEIEILDCQGLFDINQEENRVTLLKAVASMHPGPYVFLYVVKIGPYTVDEYQEYCAYRQLFGEGFNKYMIVLFTHGDLLDRHNKSIKDVLKEDDVPTELKDVLGECNNRYIVFNNKASDQHAQVEQLLSMVRDMVSQNGGEAYSCPKYD